MAANGGEGFGKRAEPLAPVWPGLAITSRGVNGNRT